MLLKFILALLVIESCLCQDDQVDDEHLYAYRVGCFNDNADDRDLPEIANITSNLTVKLCFEKCRTRHFKYAGVQDGKLCFCSDSYGHHGEALEANCKTPCVGDPNSYCGGPMRNQVYETGKIKTLDNYRLGCFQYGNNGTGLPKRHYARAMATKHFCFNYCNKRNFNFAAVQGKFCYCGDAFNSSDKVDDAKCSLPCAGDRRETCGGRKRMEVFKTDQVKKIEAPKLGCFIYKEDRSLPTLSNKTGAKTTKNLCLDHCKKNEFKYAGLRAGDTCSCSDIYGLHGKAPDNECNATCLGDSGSTCGGNNRDEVYATGVNNTVDDRKVGCFSIQNTSELVNLYSKNLPDAMTRISCYRFCSAIKRYKFAFLVTGDFCYCDIDYNKLTKTSDADCNRPCSGDKSVTCGGKSRQIQEVFSIG